MEPDLGCPLLITADSALLHAVTRLCAAAAVKPDVTDLPAEVRRAWRRAPAVMVGAESAHLLGTWALERRPDVALVVSGDELPSSWRDAVTIGADRVICLPRDDGDLIRWLADLSQGDADAGLVAAVVSAHGGAGASTFAVCLADAFRGLGRDSIVIDADAWSGGLELVVGCEQTPGVRWAELMSASGRVTGSALRDALPYLDGLAVLSAAPGDLAELTPTLVREVVVAASSVFGAVVVDLPRGTDGWLAELGDVVDVLLVVATTGVRAASAAARTVGKASAWVGDVRIVARVQPGGGADPHHVAESVGVPLAASLSTRRGTRRAIDDGVGPVLSRRDRRRVRALASELSSAAAQVRR